MAGSSSPNSEKLNGNCFCVTLDDDALRNALQAEARDEHFYERFIKPRAHLFSAAPVFLSAAEFSRMEAVVRAIEGVAQKEQYRSAALSFAPEVARQDYGPAGALMGYDFHLGDEGPRLIEINTNAGGAFLAALLASAQRACCGRRESLPSPGPVTFEEAAVRMFREEWELQRGAGRPRRIAIIDDNPEEQYLYPEFVLAREGLRRHGTETVIGNASDLCYKERELLLREEPIDLVYNRVTDFAFGLPEHAALLHAYQDGAVVVTPNPHNHALFADKRNLVFLSDPAQLEACDVPHSLRQVLDAVPKTVLVTPDNASELWSTRRKLFFKPVAGHGAKAVYRGDKVTKGVWNTIAQGGYVAQTSVRPSGRKIRVDGVPQARKIDFRLYTYRGQTLLAVARVYQGQTTNFQTAGGGFAPLFLL